MGKQWKQWQTLFWGGSKITADGDCSHEIIRRLFLGRKIRTNLDSMLQSRDVTLPTKVHLVKAMVFPVVMYGCESWTIKKAEHQRIDALELEKSLESPLDCARKSKQSILKEISPGCSLEGLMLKLKLQHFGHLMLFSWLIWKDPDAGKWRETKKSLNGSERGEWKSWLTAQHSEN